MSSFAQKFKYLALGDSYTIGEAVPNGENFPNQLIDLLKVDKNFNSQFSEIQPVKIIATTGWTTDELMRAIKLENPSAENDLVTLLIGVNNQYRGIEKGYTLEKYKTEFAELLQKAIDLIKNKKNLIVISIPDYGATPFAKELDKNKISEEINLYNLAAEKICMDNKISFINITLDSKKAEQDISLIAEDGLHPSAKMYKSWAEKIIPVYLKSIQ